MWSSNGRHKNDFGKKTGSILNEIWQPVDDLSNEDGKVWNRW